MGGTHSAYSLPAYLASHDIDAWGIDLGWTLVPQTVTDFTFMKDWGLQRDIDDLERGLEFARDIRNRTGSDGGRLTLLGWSRGGEIGYALLNQESQQHCAKRQVKGYIPVETFIKTNDSAAQSVFCRNEASERVPPPVDNNGQIGEQVGLLARTDPNGISPFLGARPTRTFRLS